MKIKKTAWLLALTLCLSAGLSVSAMAEDTQQDSEPAGQTCSVELFSVTIPDEIVDIADVETKDNTINFYEKKAHKKYGGFVGSISVYDQMTDYAYIPNFVRGGEIQYPDGSKKDIVVEYPSDVQFDFEDEESTENYKKISEALDDQILESIVPEKDGKYVPQNEVDNTAVYDEILDQLAADVKEKKDRDALVADGFSPLYANGYDTAEDPLYAFGYTFVDLTGTGYPELVIMGEDGAVVYDLFSQVDGKTEHVFSSDERDYYTLVGQEGYTPHEICEHASGGADLTETTFYMLDPATKEKYLQASFIYDGQSDPENPWAIRYGQSEDPEKFDESEWQSRLDNFGMDTYFKLFPLAVREP